jgi:hypothetical protein
MTRILSRPTPLQFWIVAVLSLLWNSFGAFDFTMTNIRDPGYLAQFPPEVIQVVDTFPLWSVGMWACGVWGALAGSLLLLLRSRFAVHAFALSLAGLAASTAYQWTLDLPAAMRTAGMTAMNLAIWAGALFLLWYAAHQRKAGVLR